MQYALLNGEKSEASPALKATCFCCNEKVIAKCGSIKVWHWSHFPKMHCDPWWENETEWHRKWKSFFPLDQQEVVHFNEEKGEKHIADVRTFEGTIIELQNSPISQEEFKSREGFYKKLIWIVNAANFKGEFYALPFRLPPPDSELAKELEIYSPPILRRYHGGVVAPPQMCRKSQIRVMEHDGLTVTYYPGKLYASNEYLRTHKIKYIEEEIDEIYDGHNFFIWKNPREVWYTSTKKVYFDFGEPVLYELIRFNHKNHCIKIIDKLALINTLGGKVE